MHSRGCQSRHRCTLPRRFQLGVARAVKTAVLVDHRIEQPQMMHRLNILPSKHCNGES